MIAKIFNSKNLLFVILLLLGNCSAMTDPNHDFVKKYGSQVKKINLTRQYSDDKESKKTITTSSNNYSNLTSSTNQEKGQYFNPDFEIKYSGNYSRFKKIGVEFDEINIPQNDAYGVSTNFDMKKEYLLIGNNYLQKNIDDITNSYEFKQNIAVSKSLIAEKKEVKIKRQKIAKKPNHQENSSQPNSKDGADSKIGDKLNKVIDSVKNVAKKL